LGCLRSQRTWTIHYNLNGNASDENCKLVVTDNKITGACKFLDKDRQVTGTVDGNKVTLQHHSRQTDWPMRASSGVPPLGMFEIGPETRANWIKEKHHEPFSRSRGFRRKWGNS
jgi:hypothetical protein